MAQVERRLDTGQDYFALSWYDSGGRLSIKILWAGPKIMKQSGVNQ